VREWLDRDSTTLGMLYPFAYRPHLGGTSASLDNRPLQITFGPACDGMSMKLTR